MPEPGLMSQGPAARSVPAQPPEPADRLAWLFRRAGDNQAAQTLQQALRQLRQPTEPRHG